MVSVGDKAQASWANKRGECCGGVVTITPSAANTATSATVTFPFTFTATPTVVASLEQGLSQYYQVGVTGWTTTGCVVWLTSPNTTTRNVAWIAVN